MLRIPTVFVLLVVALASWGCASTHLTTGQVVSPYYDMSTLEEGQIVHLPTGRMMSEDELVDHLDDLRIVYVGESHDSVQDHAIQLTLLKRMVERFPGRVALGMEMLRLPAQGDADRWSAGEMEEKEFVRVWQENWGNSFIYYADILRFVRDNHIPLIALNRERRMHGGPALAEGDASSEPPPPPPQEPEIAEDDPYYEAVIGAFFGAHGKGKPEIQKMFLRGQILWDETMAQTAAGYLQWPGNEQMKLLVFAGGNHVRHGYGIPRRVFRRLPATYAIVEPWTVFFPEEKKDKLMDVSFPELPLPLADFAWGVSYEDLEDQRVLLGVRIEDSEEPVGVKVVFVMEKSSAEKAGIKAEDVIVEVDGVALIEIFDLTYEVSQKQIGTAGMITVIRGVERLEIALEYQAAEPKEEKE